MKMLLFIIPLLFGCAREYRCDAGPPCELDTSEIPDDLTTVTNLGTICDAIITVEWLDGEMEAEAECDEMYNDAPTTGERTWSCTCEKDN